MTWRRAREPDHVGNSIQKINIPFIISTRRSMVEKALLDSGAMENFLDHCTTKQLGITTQPLE